MTLITSYLITTKNLESFFNALVSAQAPERFTQKFLESLEFKSTNDRLFISLLKGLGFIDESGAPLDRYYRFLDQSESKKVVAEATQEAYSDLFAVKKDAQTLSLPELKGKLKTLTQGSKTDNVINLMANTFNALAQYADWESPSNEKVAVTSRPEIQQKEIKKEGGRIDKNQIEMDLHYNIQIHLPESRDTAVYDAIFKSLKEHLG